MAHAAHHTQVPRGPLLAIAGIVVASVLAVAGVRLTGIGATQMPADAPVAVRALRFEDRPDGSIAILDATGRDAVMEIEPGTNGFLRSTMRGLARERKRSGASSEIPFQLAAHADGRLTLEDPATGRRVDLGSFGPTNAGVFARIMSSAAATRAGAAN
jgi:putative photosynthetic complex assembly protein